MYGTFHAILYALYLKWCKQYTGTHLFVIAIIKDNLSSPI